MHCCFPLFHFNYILNPVIVYNEIKWTVLLKNSFTFFFYLERNIFRINRCEFDQSSLNACMELSQTPF
jgi:hypothetical protein